MLNSFVYELLTTKHFYTQMTYTITHVKYICRLKFAMFTKHAVVVDAQLSYKSLISERLKFKWRKCARCVLEPHCGSVNVIEWNLYKFAVKHNKYANMCKFTLFRKLCSALHWFMIDYTVLSVWLILKRRRIRITNRVICVIVCWINNLIIRTCRQH